MYSAISERTGASQLNTDEYLLRIFIRRTPYRYPIAMLWTQISKVGHCNSPISVFSSTQCEEAMGKPAARVKVGGMPRPQRWEVSLDR